MSQTAAGGNAQSAYEHIRRAIVEGRYRPGQRLVEQRVAEEFALSRTPVREALRRLQAEGLVDSEPNRGAVVRPIALNEVPDLYGLRARLEAYACELAAERITPEQLAAIDAGIAAFDEAITARYDDHSEQVRALDAANHQIHSGIHAAAGHVRLGQVLDRTIDVPLVFQAFRQFDRDQVERSHLFHRLIRDAIAAGDGQRAAALMSEHVLQGRDVLVSHLRAHDAGTDEVFDSGSAGEGAGTG